MAYELYQNPYKDDPLVGEMITKQASLMNTLIREINKQEEGVLRQVLSTLLGREAVNEDAKRLCKRYNYNPLEYDLFFDGIKIGRVERTHYPEFKITFIPD